MTQSRVTITNPDRIDLREHVPPFAKAVTVTVIVTPPGAQALLYSSPGGQNPLMVTGTSVVWIPLTEQAVYAQPIGPGAAVELRGPYQIEF